MAPRLLLLAFRVVMNGHIGIRQPFADLRDQPLCHVVRLAEILLAPDLDMKIEETFLADFPAPELVDADDRRMISKDDLLDVAPDHGRQRPVKQFADRIEQNLECRFENIGDENHRNQQIPEEPARDSHQNQRQNNPGIGENIGPVMELFAFQNQRGIGLGRSPPLSFCRPHP